MRQVGGQSDNDSFCGQSPGLAAGTGQAVGQAGARVNILVKLMWNGEETKALVFFPEALIPCKE